MAPRVPSYDVLSSLTSYEQVMRNSFEADILDRRNQLSRSEHGADGQKFMKSEADDEQLQYKLEHATYIDGVEHEAELANFTRWSRPIDLIQDSRMPYTGLEHIRPEAKGQEILDNVQNGEDEVQHELQGPSPQRGSMSGMEGFTSTTSPPRDNSDSSQSSPIVPETPEQEGGSPSQATRDGLPESPTRSPYRREPAQASLSTQTNAKRSCQANGDASSDSSRRTELSPSAPPLKKQRVSLCNIG